MLHEYKLLYNMYFHGFTIKQILAVYTLTFSLVGFYKVM